jgi:hypothetical protein
MPLYMHTAAVYVYNCTAYYCCVCVLMPLYMCRGGAEATSSSSSSLASAAVLKGEARKVLEPQ